jgi:hypothetical protein
LTEFKRGLPSPTTVEYLTGTLNWRFFGALTEHDGVLMNTLFRELRRVLGMYPLTMSVCEFITIALMSASFLFGLSQYAWLHDAAFMTLLAQLAGSVLTFLVFIWTIRKEDLNLPVGDLPWLWPASLLTTLLLFALAFFAAIPSGSNLSSLFFLGYVVAAGIGTFGLHGMARAILPSILK